MRLIGKVAIVTGGGSGLGKATCQRFAEEGALVVVTDINLESARQVVADILATDGKAQAKHQDVTDERRWTEILEQVVSDHGRLDILVNNAGVALAATVEDETLEKWRKTQAVNGESVFMGTRAAIAVMKEQGGSIINISSVEGLIGEPLAAAYNFSKGGVRIFTKSAALHCAAKNYAIRVNSLHPGYIATPMIEQVAQTMDPEVVGEWQARVMGSIPVGRMGEPIDIANGCLFLASDESRYMTGAELVIDGGYTAR